MTTLARRFPPLSRVMRASPAERSVRERRRDLLLALVYGGACHGLFAAAVVAMIVAMWFGMSRSFGGLTAPWSYVGNAALLLQFPVLHSLLLSSIGRRVLARLAPSGTGPTLSTTTFAIVASVQLLLLFAFWSPSGVVWWRAEGWLLAAVAGMYALSWLLLIKASWDAGAEVQSGLLGWVSLLRGVRPPYPPMPTTGTFRYIRQPIYASFALTTWCVPVWTPDQLAVAVTLSAYCLLGPLLKERRFARSFGDRWHSYRARTPYWIPRLRSRP
ncbi:MAG: isoprenylcysteine carboxylmethyltransferase family protein [Thalassobaculaceae bacterium]|uniref:methyltransferase family protein n=1 Tax=Roseitalea porphyridii TaxID=1852022 RepID=UPI0032EE5564